MKHVAGGIGVRVFIDRAIDYPIIFGLQYNPDSLFGDLPQCAPYRFIEWVKHDDFPKENFLGTRCYPFATQLSNIGRRIEVPPQWVGLHSTCCCLPTSNVKSPPSASATRILPGEKPPIMDCTLFEGPAEITKEVALFSDA